MKNGWRLADAYHVRIVEMLPGEKRPHRLAHFHDYVRLYRKSAGSFSDSTVHDTVQLRGGAQVSRLENVVHHRSMRGTFEQIEKFNAYSSDLARDMVARKRRFSYLRLVFEMPMSFLKAYLFRMYFLRGSTGFIVSMNYAIFRHLRIAKHLELKKAAESARD
ncbi:MAG: hypothetical protein J0H15_08660 [Xanthomonadales bacterium]|nr:hypothetical protein [Xanthomonadales bacterium]